MLLCLLTAPDPGREVVLVATIQDGDCESLIIGMAQLHITDSESCEAAVVVSDNWQRRGLGLHLLRVLGRIATQGGVTRIFEEVLNSKPDARGSTQVRLRVSYPLGCPFLVRTNEMRRVESPG